MSFLGNIGMCSSVPWGGLAGTPLWIGGSGGLLSLFTKWRITTTFKKIGLHLYIALCFNTCWQLSTHSPSLTPHPVSEQTRR